MKLIGKAQSVVVLGIILFCTFICPPILVAEVPARINYQGYLTDTSGNPVADGDYAMGFAIFDVPTSGTALWSESQTVSLAGGLYNVELGLNPFSDDLFDGDLYLEVEVNGEIFAPRKRLIATPFAMKAALSDGVVDGGVTNVMIADNAVNSQKLSDNSVTSTKITDGSLTAVDIQDGSTLTEILDDDGTGSGLDADSLDGLDASAFSSATHDHDTQYVNVTGDGMVGSTPDFVLGVTNVGTGHGVGGSVTGTDSAAVYGEATNTGTGINVGGYLNSTRVIVCGVYGEAPYTGNVANYGGYFSAAGANGSGVYGTASGSSGRGVYGEAPYTGNVTNYGGYFTASGYTGRGAYGSASGAFGRGVYGEATGANGYGVYGSATNSGDVTNYGARFEAYGTNGNGIRSTATGSNGTGVFGEATNNGNVTNYGGYFTASGYTGIGVYSNASGYEGVGVFVEGGKDGIRGEAREYGVHVTASGALGHGVYGAATNTSNTTRNYGGYFIANGGDGVGVYGGAPGETGIGVYGREWNGNNSYAGYFNGRVYVTDFLVKAGGGFKIDHPLEPENKYLNHSFVESPDMMNMYNGNVVLDNNGEAWVELPEWFETLNKDFRYQLTAIGEPGPNLYIAEKISDNQFKIAGGKPNMEISWQVTGVRQDPWAEANRLVVEEDKTDKELGYYMHPEAYGQPEEKSIEWVRDPEGMRRMKEEREKREASTS